MSSNTPSIRDIARALGLSATTVSQALRNKPIVKLATRKRVQDAAAAAGYQSNPLAGSLMAEMRRKRGAAFHATIAIIDLDGAEDRPSASAAYHRELLEGALERAAELGFKSKIFQKGNGLEAAQKIESLLQSRGIHAALLLPVTRFETVTRHNWSRCACLYTDYGEGREGHAAMHNICPDHIGAMRAALRHLRALGYRRPGLVVNQDEESRIFGRWGSAFGIFNASLGQHIKDSTLIMSGDSKREFSDWFKNYQPDVVIGHGAEIMGWMRECGANIPTTHGFCCLNIIKNPDLACAGIDQQPRLLGSRGIELVVAQLQRGEYGLPGQPMNTSVPSMWVDGPTLRALVPTVESAGMTPAESLIVTS